MEAYTPETSAVLSRFWYPVALSEEVRPGPFACEILERPVVLYRCGDGIAAARDVCPHRGAKLSGGWVEDDGLVCPYHGLRYGGDGRCLAIPSAGAAGRIPRKIRLETYRAVERYGLVWVCLAEDPLAPLPDWTVLEREDLQSVGLPAAEWQTSAGRHAENFNDIAHLSWIHAGTFGNRADPVIEPYEVDVGPTGLNRSFTYNQVDRDTFHAGQEVVTPMIYAYSFTYPFASALKISAADGRDLHIFDAVCPVTPSRCRIFIRLAKNYDRDEPMDALVEFQEAVNEEDRRVVESQVPKMVPLDPRHEGHIAADAWSLAYRKGFTKLGLETSAFI